MKRPTPNQISILCVLTGLAIGYTYRTIDNQINNFAGVGGIEEYERQRAYHLERLRKNDHVKDKATRERDAAAIEAEIDELGRGFPVQEWGGELRRVK